MEDQIYKSCAQVVPGVLYVVGYGMLPAACAYVPLIAPTHENAMRIVSLVSSATEIVASLGLTHCVVGRSHECEYPPEVSDLPICTSPVSHYADSGAAINGQYTTPTISNHKVTTNPMAAS